MLDFILLGILSFVIDLFEFSVFFFNIVVCDKDGFLGIFFVWFVMFDVVCYLIDCKKFYSIL